MVGCRLITLFSVLGLWRGGVMMMRAERFEILILMIIG